MKAHEIANKEELIKALRKCGKASADRCWDCDYYDREPWCESALANDAADALEADDEKIADYTAAIEALDDSNDAYIKENERLKKRIAVLEQERNKTVTAIFGEEQLWWENRCKELEAERMELTAKCGRLETQMPKEGEWITTRTENHDGEIY